MQRATRGGSARRTRPAAPPPPPRAAAETRAAQRRYASASAYAGGANCSSWGCYGAAQLVSLVLHERERLRAPGGGWAPPRSGVNSRVWDPRARRLVEFQARE